MSKHIVVLATLDTKGEEAEYLKRLIEARGFKALLLDTSIGGERASFVPSVPERRSVRAPVTWLVARLPSPRSDQY